MQNLQKSLQVDLGRCLQMASFRIFAEGVGGKGTAYPSAKSKGSRRVQPMVGAEWDLRSLFRIKLFAEGGAGAE